MNATILSQTHHPQSGSVWGLFAAAMRAMAEANVRRRARRLAAQSLRTLSDRTLKDIGMHRSEICSVVHDTSNERKRFYESA